MVKTEDKNLEDTKKKNDELIKSIIMLDENEIKEFKLAVDKFYGL